MISRVAVGAAPVSAVVSAASSRGDPGRAGAETSRGVSHAVASSKDAASSRRLIGPPRRRWGNATPELFPRGAAKVMPMVDVDERRHVVWRRRYEEIETNGPCSDSSLGPHV